jgi:hypothetical protein
MKLSEQDAELFFNLMWSLQSYVNLKLGILPEIETLEAYKRLPSSQKLEVRDALYDNIELIDTYLVDNPHDLVENELEIIKSWKKFVRRDFFIERLLKKYAVFIGGDKVYGVSALLEPLEDVLPHITLPYYAKAVLLPFKGEIIYDGLLQGYNVIFGSGIKFELKETYMAAKQNGQIIESFDPEIQSQKAARKKKPLKDWGPTLEEISQQARKLRSSGGAPPIHSPAFGLTKASIEFARLAVANPEATDELWKALEKVERALAKTETVLYRTRT